MRRRDFLTGVVLAAGSACSRRKASLLQKLRVGAARRLSTSSLHLANELGFFREAGFELEILQSGAPLNSVALLAGGKIDVYLTGCSVTLLNAVIKGLQLRIVAGRQVASPGCGDTGAIYALRRTFPNGLADLRQLKGKRVAVSQAIGFAQFALDAHLATVGLSMNDVITIGLDIKQNVAALFGGGVDATVGGEDFEHELAALPEIVHSPGLASIYPGFQHSYIVFGQTLLAADPDRGARFLSAYLRGAREFARGKTPRFMEQFARAYGLDVKRAVTACRDSFALDGAINLNSLRLLTGWAARRKFISRPMDLSELVDDRFLRRAHAS